MKITFVRPNIGRLDGGRYVDEGRMEPLPLGVLAGMTPPDVETALFDDRMEEVRYDDSTDLAAISVETFNARRAYQIADEYRRRGVRVIMGGIHVTLVPGEAAEHADSILTGDAEAVWPRAVEDARRGSLLREYRGGTGVPQGSAVPNRDLFRGKGYLNVTLTQFNRGCPHACEFCAVSAASGRRAFHRPVSDVVREIREQAGRNVFFVDDNIAADPGAAKELFRALIPLRVRWVSQAAVDVTEDPELMDLMEESGCRGLVIGFESIDPDNLRDMKKTPGIQAGLDAYARVIGIFRDHHLQNWAAFTIGHDHDTPESIERLTDFALDAKFAFAAFNVLTPYPGTPLYARLASEGRLLYGGAWWTHPDYRFNSAAFRPRLMSADELTEAGLRARTRFNSPGSIFLRALDFKTHLRSPLRLGMYFSYNSLFRRETFKKQGMRLGGAEGR